MRFSKTTIALAAAVGAAALAGCGGGTSGERPDVPAVRGEADRGKVVFAEADCGSCHELADAGTDGGPGPALDGRSVPFEDVLAQVVDGGGGMPDYRDRLDVQELQDVATYVARFTDPG